MPWNFISLPRMARCHITEKSTPHSDTLLARAIITLPRLLRLLLMFLVSLNLSPVDPDWERRSDPARSTRFSVPRGDSHRDNAYIVCAVIVQHRC